MRNKKGAFVLFVTAIGVIGLTYYAWPEHREVTVRQHVSAMESAWQQHLTAPDAPEHKKAFLHHRDELLRLGYLQKQSFQVPVRPGTPESKELVSALIERAESRPVCEWTPVQTMMLVTVFASAEQMPQWEAMLARWNNVP